MSSSVSSSTTTTRPTTPKVSCFSLYAFRGDPSSHQLTFPARAWIEIDTSQRAQNGWLFGRYYDNMSYHRGWFPSSYVQFNQEQQQQQQPDYRNPSRMPSETAIPSFAVHSSLPNPSSSSSPLSRPRFTDTFHYNNNNNNSSQYTQSLRGIDPKRQQGLSSSSPSPPLMGVTTTASSYTIDENETYDNGRNDDDDDAKDDDNDNGFNVDTNQIMGGKIMNGDSASGNDDDEDDSSTDGWESNSGKKTKKKNGGWLSRNFGGLSLSKNKKKIQPVSNLLTGNNDQKAKEPEWYAEPQIVLSDGTIIQEYKPKNRNLFSHLSDAASVTASTITSPIRHHHAAAAASAAGDTTSGTAATANAH